MKTAILLGAFLFHANLSFADTHLNSGEFIVLNGETITCGGNGGGNNCSCSSDQWAGTCHLYVNGTAIEKFWGYAGDAVDCLKQCNVRRHEACD